jgi:hypothetical protein
VLAISDGMAVICSLLSPIPAAEDVPKFESPSRIEGGHQNDCQTGAYQRNEHPTKNDAIKMDGAAARTVTYESRNILKSRLHRLYASDETEEIPDPTNIAGKCMAEMVDAAPNNEQLQRYRKESGWSSPAKVVGRINRSVRYMGAVHR